MAVQHWMYFHSSCLSLLRFIVKMKMHLLVFLQKIFVMPNMDDIWLPIMHSAMDARSNANLVTVTNDALKEPEAKEPEVSDM